MIISPYQALIKKIMEEKGIDWEEAVEYFNEVD